MEKPSKPVYEIRQSYVVYCNNIVMDVFKTEKEAKKYIIQMEFYDDMEKITDGKSI